MSLQLSESANVTSQNEPMDVDTHSTGFEPTAADDTRPPSQKSDAAIRSALKKVWVKHPALVVFTDGSAHRAHAVAKREGTWYITFESTPPLTDDEQFWLDVKDFDPTDVGIKQIIHDFFLKKHIGSPYHAIPRELVLADDGPTVVFDCVMPDGVQLFEQGKMPLARFIDAFKLDTMAVEELDGDEEPEFDFALYPHLRNILEAMHAFGPDGGRTLMGAVDAWLLLTSLANPQDAADHQRTEVTMTEIADMANTLEAEFNPENSSPLSHSSSLSFGASPKFRRAANACKGQAHQILNHEATC